MAKKINVGLIDLELDKLETKVNEFQTYLQVNNIVTEVTKNNEVILAEEIQEVLHKEIAMQIKMVDALLNWMPLLKKLKEDEAAKQEFRGGAEANGLFKKHNK